MKVTKTSMFSGKTHTREINITPAQLERWQNGHHAIQAMFPHLPAEDREFLMTGVTPEEWDEHMGREDEEERVIPYAESLARNKQQGQGG